jgi:hypothetical protein
MKRPIESDYTSLVAYTRALEEYCDALSWVEQEPVEWMWYEAPVKTQWGHDMVVADLAINKDNTVSVYCEREQTTKVEAMFTPPAAQPAPVQEPVASNCTHEWLDDTKDKPQWRCVKCGENYRREQA